MQVHKIDTFAGHRDCVYTLDAGASPTEFFSAGADGLVVRWQLDKPDLGSLLARIPASVYALAFDPERKQLWVGQNYDGIHIIDPVQKQEIRSAQITSAALFDIKIFEGQAWVALSDGVLVVMDVAEFVVKKHLKVSDKSARSITINPISREVAVGYSDNGIRIFDLDLLTLKKIIPAHTNSIFAVQYSPDGRFLLSAGRDAHLKIWAVDDKYSQQNDIAAHLFAINHICYSPDGALFATCSMDKSIKVWDAATFRLLKVIDRARHAGHGTSVNKLLWSPYQQQLISASDDRLISVWEITR
ncbi:WD40 repeat domain-containing protein [Larkinella rosea]|uniref:WD40 repeat domain-containing protein n=1 Tax=Larkinella rosea TaxID=2025312 RepID=A0A3P1BAF5_9BACT|nr:WD40 repeat domain-containing protein [Larkinella rosea]RRA97633.1 WD40 repeat domain-containing protein [Larkinella rosea]